MIRLTSPTTRVDLTMLKHPDRDRLLAVIQTALAPQFEFSLRFLTFWLTTRKDRWLARSGLTENVVHVAMLLDLQICRLFNSVIEECAQGEALTATIATRTMYESVLPLLFVTAKNVKIATQPLPLKPGQQGPQKYRAVVVKRGSGIKAKLRPDRTRRASLFIAHSAFQEERFRDRCKNTRGLRRYAKSKSIRIDPSFIAKFANDIGAEWTSVLRNNPHTYSGLNVRELASCLRPELLRWYDILYFIQSKKVHGTDALFNIGHIPDGQYAPRWFSSIDELRGALLLGVSLFRVSLRILQDNIRFGVAVETALDSFGKEWSSIDADDITGE